MKKFWEIFCECVALVLMIFGVSFICFIILATR